MAAEYPNITSTHKDYEDKKKSWESITGFYTDDSDIILKTMVQHKHEDSQDFEKRKDRALYVNVVRTVIYRLTAIFLASGVSRLGFSEEVGTFEGDADGYGTSLNACITSIVSTILLFGKCYVFVDYSVSEDDTSEIKLEEDPLPTIEIFTPLELRNWKKIKRKGFEWVIGMKKKIVDEQEKEVYYKIDYEQIAQVDSSGNDISPVYDHGLGYTPFFEVTLTPSYKDGFGQELSEAAASALQLYSDVDTVAVKHTFSQLTVPDDGSLDEAAYREQEDINTLEGDGTTTITETVAKQRALVAIGSSQVLAFPANTGQPPQFISADCSQIAELWNIYKDVLKLTLFTTGLADMLGVWDEQIISLLFGSLAYNMETLERNIFKTYYAYLGSQMDEKIKIRYPDSYPLENLDDWLAKINAISSSVLSDEAKRVLLTAVSLKLPIQLDVADKALLYSALDKTEFTTPGKEKETTENIEVTENA